MSRNSAKKRFDVTKAGLEEADPEKIRVEELRAALRLWCDSFCKSLFPFFLSLGLSIFRS